MSSKKRNDKEKRDSLEEELRQLKTKVAQLEGLLADKDKEASTRNGQVSKLEQSIADRNGEIASLKQSQAEADEQIKHLGDSLGLTVKGYKTLAIEAHTQVPAELISGDTIEAIQDSLTKAKALVGKVRQGLEAEVMSARVPLGAPVRTPPDFSALSASEKIKQALGGK